MPVGFCILLLMSEFLLPVARAQSAVKANLNITFVNTINNIPVILDSTTYTNCWNENFTISKLKYYISHVQLQQADKKIIPEQNSYHLINEEDTVSKSILLYMPPATYTSLSFLIGVDSLMNVSGAQTGALDPLNGMFWTWNNGYIMFKLEGSSPQSTAVNNKLAYHIGGFAGTDKVLRTLTLQFNGDKVVLKKESTTTLIIQVDIGKIWNAKHDLKINQVPACMTPGALAAGIADNYAQAFELIKITTSQHRQ